MAKTSPSASEIRTFFEQLGEVRRGLSPVHQKYLDTMIALALERRGSEVSAYWGPGTPSTAIGTVDWATSVFGTKYGSAWND